MFYDPGLLKPKSLEEARKSFSDTWNQAETMISGRKEAMRFYEKWKSLSDDARATIEFGARDHFGDDMDVDELLSCGVIQWNGYDNDQMRAQALRFLIAWWELENGKPKKWFADSGNSAFVDFLIEEMRRHEYARKKATPSGVRTLLKHIAR